MISKKTAEALNEQIGKELYSSHLYLAMGAYLQAEGLPGMAGWLKAHAEEERGHAMRLIKYVEDQGAPVRLSGIAEPPAEYGSPRQVFEAVLDHERKITASIHALVELAIEERDFATQAMLQWFVTEQVEEESVASETVAKFKMIGGDARGIYLLDRELGQRK